MSNTTYELYRKSCILLARSITFKCEELADEINRGLLNRGEVVSNDPYTWKYYQNLAGEYHYTNTLMRITSLDSQEEIDFTKANLALHTATAAAYVHGSDYLKALMDKYPNQRSLIRGIILPADITEAIEAKNGTILSYDKSLVEEAETTLIPRLQVWIYNTITRWHTGAYTLSDEYYMRSWLGIVSVFLINEIMLIRKSECHTIHTHSFHIRMYLASHNGLDKYLDILTAKQALFLYRNIRYIRNNAGKSSTFELLMKYMLTDRRLPLAEYVMKHDITTLSTDLKPEVIFEKNGLNLPDLQLPDTKNYTVTDLLTKELEIAPGNADELHDANIYVTRKGRYSLSNTLKTKVLESSVVDTSDAEYVTTADMLLYNWVNQAYNGRYVAKFSVPTPDGNSVLLNALDCFILWLYCYSASTAVPLDVVPLFDVYYVAKEIQPSDDELRDIITDEYYDQGIIDFIRKQSVDNSVIYSASEFYKRSIALKEAYLRRRLAYATQEDYLARGFYNGVVNYFYEHRVYNLGGSGITSYKLSGFDMNGDLNPTATDITSVQTYDEWLSSKGIVIANYLPYDLKSTANWLWENVTGLNLNNRRTLKEIQAAMLSIMSKLSSYTVQYIADINKSADIIIDNPAVRPGKTETKCFVASNVDVASVTPMQTYGRAKSSVELDTSPTFTGRAVGVSWTSIDRSVDWERNTDLSSYSMDVDIASVRVLDDVSEELELIVLGGFEDNIATPKLNLDGLPDPS